MAQELDRSPHIAVVHAIDQDEAATWTRDRWESLDFVIVDVYDEYAPGEIGTDVFSGIPAIERLRNFEVDTLAVMPHRHHPLGRAARVSGWGNVPVPLVGDQRLGEAGARVATPGP